MTVFCSKKINGKSCLERDVTSTHLCPSCQTGADTFNFLYQMAYEGKPSKGVHAVILHDKANDVFNTYLNITEEML